MSAADEVKARLDIVEVIGQSVPLKRAGRLYRGLCPFHSEKTPSFVVYPEQGTWHCFGACGTGGDVFTFVMKKDNLDFGEALHVLAERAGVELTRDAGGEQNNKLLFEINDAAVGYYNYLLKSSPGAQFVRDYLIKRQISPSSVDAFQLGFAPKSQDGLLTHLQAKGFARADIERAGLCLTNDSGAVRDRFWGRLMFPIRNRRGKTIAFGARAMYEEQEPKYLNSPDTPLFSKSDTLYGLDIAKDSIRSENRAIIVEGYTDVIIAHQSGFKNVVASLGTALTEKQLGQLGRLTKRYVLALDSDAAGQAAGERGLELARSAVSRKQVPIPVGPGLIRFEEHLEAELLIMSLPEGKDPDEVILESPAQWMELVENAVPLVVHNFQLQTRDLDLQTAHGKAEAVRRLLPVIGEIGDPVERAHYVQELARLVQTDERVIAQQLKSAPAKAQPSKPVPAASRAPVRAATARYDDYLLTLVFYQPELFGQVGFLSPDDFEEGATREIWQSLLRYTQFNQIFDLDEFLEGLSDAARETGSRLREDAKRLQFNEEDVGLELEATANRMRLQRYQNELTQLRYLLGEVSPDEEQVLTQRVHLVSARIAETRRAIEAHSVLNSSITTRIL